MGLFTGVLSEVSTWLILFILTGLTLIWYLTKRHDYWKKVGLPYIKPTPILGSMGTVFANPPHEVEVQRYKEKGRIYGTYEGANPVLTMGDLDILKEMLVKDSAFFNARRDVRTGNPLFDKMLQMTTGEEWKRVRSHVTPAFSTGKIKRMTSIFVECAQTLVQNFHELAKDGKSANTKRLFGAYSMDVIANCAFGTKIDCHNDPDNPFVVAATTMSGKNIPLRFILMLVLPGLMKFFKFNVVNPVSLEFFKSVSLKIIEERKRTGQRRNDFLQLMIDAGQGSQSDESIAEYDPETEMGHENENSNIFKPQYRTKSLSKDEMISQCISFFMAGHDSTSSTMSFAAYELAVNPDIQERLFDGIDETIRQKGELSYEAIYEMKYLNNVVSETLRKYPPGYRGERKALDDYPLKGHNFTIPKGMLVGIPIYAIHHDPEYYPDPEKFDPDRFNDDQKHTRHPFSYIPFGAGPRNCVAMRFALMQVKTCLAFVLSQCRFTTCSETNIPIEFFKGTLQMQPKPMMLKVEMRQDAIKI